MVESAVTNLPNTLTQSGVGRRLELAMLAAQSLGPALLAVRGTSISGVEDGDQLKTSIDRAAEGWVLGWLESEFHGETVLAEERFSEANKSWQAPETYWTVDALDGTRSFIEGFPGFCIQLAWIDGGKPKLGIIVEPVAGRVYAAATGGGAWRLGPDGAWRRLGLRSISVAPLRFVDSIRPSGIVGDWLKTSSGTFVECGSCGLKLARIAEDSADLYAKRFRYRIWDVAPGQVLLDETGGQLGQWDGSPVRYDTTQVEWSELLVAPASIFSEAVQRLAVATSDRQHIG